MGEKKYHIKRDELFCLHKHYESIITEHLSFCYRYLHFYIALLSAILAGTLTGLLKIKDGDLRGLTLLIGPILVMFLARIGYQNVKVFYRRFVEAWITVLNIEIMLGLKGSIKLECGLREPLYKSKYNGGFITEFERPKVREILDDAKCKSWSAEKVLEEVLKTGDTLQFAKKTFLAFCISGFIFFVVIAYYQICK